MAANSLAPSLPQMSIPGLIEDENFRFSTELEFERQELNQLREIWREKTRAKGSVTRAAFDARTLKLYLSNMLILDVVGQENGTRRYRYRYMGSSLVEVFGEQTHRFIDDFIPPDKVARWSAAHDLIVLKACALRILVNYTSPQIDCLGSEGLFFPLVDGNERVIQIMGFNYVEGTRRLTRV